MRRIGVILVALSLLGGCRGRDFSTQAFYDAPRSAFRLMVFASGTVEPGADLSDKGSGTVFLCPRFASARAARMELGPGAPLRFDIEGGPSGTLAWVFGASATSLLHVLSLGGYPPSSGPEIDEAVNVMNGALGGPKSTFMPGQTASLGVVRVDLHASPPPPGFSICRAP